MTSEISNIASEFQVQARPSLSNFSEFLPEGLSLYPFQAEMIQQKLNSPSPIIYNASEQGVGKSIEASVYASIRLSEIRGRRPQLLVVSPAALCPLWVEETTKWLPSHIDVATVSYTKLVTNSSLYGQILNHPWDGIIQDEFHACRNIQAQTTTQAIRLWRSARMFVLPMSGTPIENSAADLFPFMHAASLRLPYISQQSKDYCSDYDYFGQTFANAKQQWRGGQVETVYRKTRNEAYLNWMLYDEFRCFFRDEFAKVMPQLPELTCQVVPIELSARNALDSQAYRSFDTYDALYESGHDRAYMATQRRLLGIAKASCKMFLEFVENFLLQGEPVIIFGYHTEVMQSLFTYFEKWAPVLCTGDETAKQKQQAVKDFQEGKAHVFLGNLHAAGKGWTLTRACNVIVLECDWLPSVVDQALKRALRISQTRKVFAWFVKSQVPFDDHIMRSMVSTQKSIEKVI